MVDVSEMLMYRYTYVVNVYIRIEIHSHTTKLNAKRLAYNADHAAVCLLDVGNGLTCRGGMSEAI